MTITQHAEDLMHTVASVRSSCRGRPLIFIAHSLGGILVKGAICESQQMIHTGNQPGYADIRQSCYAIVFMGTPHLGADIAAWGGFMSDIVGALPGGFTTYSSVLKGLAPDSETLSTIYRRFNDILDKHDPTQNKIQICSVQEGGGMSNVKGAGKKVVPDYSSKFSRSEFEQAFFIQAVNHMDMCKFSSADHESWKKVRRQLEGYAFNLKKDRAALRQTHDAVQRADNSELLEKLHFGSRLTREHQLNSLITNSESFEWVWKSSFATWIESDEKLFWITGHPASGKSTLVDYLARSSKLTEMLKNKSGEGALIIKIFFDFRGKLGIENNFEGLWRVLLYQLLSGIPDLAASVKFQFGLDRPGIGNPLHDVRLLEEILEFVLLESPRPIILFLDGLDEYQGQKAELLSLIEKLVTYNAKICLSSRYEKPFNTAFRNLKFSFRMNEVNFDGIKAFARHMMTVGFKPDGDLEIQTLDNVIETIATRSNGVFLWARFTVFEVIDAAGSGYRITSKMIQDILNRLPIDLEERYARVIESRTPDERRSCVVIFQLLIWAKKALEVSELFEATQLAGVEFLPLEAEVSNHNLSEFQIYLGAYSGGVVETINTHDDVVVVRLIHDTVYAYLKKRGWNELLGKQLSPESPHLLWLQICIASTNGNHTRWTQPVSKYIWDPSESFNYDRISVDKDHRGGSTQTDIGSLFQTQAGAQRPRMMSFTSYAFAFLPFHAYDFEVGTCQSSWNLIHSTLGEDFVRKHVRILEKMHGMGEWFAALYGDQISKVMTNDMHLAIAHRLVRYVEDAVTLHSKPYVSKARDAEFTSDLIIDKEAICLKLAVISNCESPCFESSKLIHLLVSSSPRLNDAYMLYAIRNMSSVELKALLTKFPDGPLRLCSKYDLHEGFSDDVESGFSSRFTFGPLWEVGRRKYSKEAVAVLEMFLARGEDINMPCGPHGNIFHATMLDVLVPSRGGYKPYHSTKAMFEEFVNHGADINARGSEGNVLEWFWMQINTLEPPQPSHPVPYQLLIKLCIELGATNSVKDPNGLIPTPERMLDFGTRYESQKYFYLHGI